MLYASSSPPSPVFIAVNPGLIISDHRIIITLLLLPPGKGFDKTHSH
ncbi:hypothetical protein GCWU000342_00127 [Shuttleworthella satelles DSM 14600]|uniref:Uncharacterized protein n=1 Tax=Shuttleworthella satelles DSM 14600 TaxID=626523 RepID=C4G857_9FIRM|nr:hypothetical protein GCWU000342_00127 [Shuttleworthia satelles DSM 14600]